MPVKNTAKFLHECIDSIIHQSFTDWELIAINDHSTDTSEEILHKYAQKDNRIKVLNNKGEGIIPALQLAYKHSNGKYITRMDSDDICTKNKLEVLQSKLKQKGKGHLAIGKVQYFAENQLGEGYRNYAHWLNKLTAKGENFSEIFKECVIPSPCWMLHKGDLEKCGAFSNDIYPEDYDLCFRMLQAKLSCIPCNEVLHLWRDHSFRSSRTDKNYADNHFSELKVKYFLEIHWRKEKETIIWGAGKKGKKVAQLFIKNKIDFQWICNNPNKIGLEIYNKKLMADSNIHNIETPQVIVCVANKAAQAKIRETLNKLKLQNMKDYFFFC